MTTDLTMDSGSAAWRNLAEFTLPFQPDLGQEVVMRVSQVVQPLRITLQCQLKLNEALLTAAQAASPSLTVRVLVPGFSAEDDKPAQGGWGFFLVETSTAPGDPEKGFGHLVQVFLYLEGESYPRKADG